jgi:hypothetical protein
MLTHPVVRILSNDVGLRARDFLAWGIGGFLVFAESGW